MRPNYKRRLGARRRARASHSSRPRVVVGVDGSRGSNTALESAVRESVSRGLPLEIVRVRFARREAGDIFGMLDQWERQVLEAAMERARRLAPKLELIGQCVEPPPVTALVQASRGAELLVVGSRRFGELQGFQDSVSQRCAELATCPVLLVSTPAGHAVPATHANRGLPKASRLGNHRDSSDGSLARDGSEPDDYGEGGDGQLCHRIR